VNFDEDQMKRWIEFAAMGLTFAWFAAAPARGQDQAGAYRNSSDYTDARASSAQPEPVDSPAATDDSNRSDTLEAFGEIGGGFVARSDFGHVYGTADGFQRSDERFKLDRDFLGGGGLGFNFGPFINLSADFTAGTLRTHLTPTNGAGQPTLASAATANGMQSREMVHVELYPIPGPLTPVIAGSVGGVGMTAHSYNFTSSETDFAWGAAAGVRWDLSRDLFLKLLYQQDWFKFRASNQTSREGSILFSVGCKF
jgi:hypothetical protein